MRDEHYSFRRYKSDDYNRIVNTMISEKYLRKYLNKGLLFSVLSYCGLYKSTLYLLECNSDIVASGVIRRKFDITRLKITYWLYGIEVVEQQRGKGIGSLLVKKILENMQKNCIKQVFLKVRKNNMVALNLYAKYGFERYKEQDSSYILFSNI